MNSIIRTSNVLTVGRAAMPQRYEVGEFGLKDKLAGAGNVVEEIYKKSFIADFWTVLTTPVR
jgi:hypothetical protein